MYNVYCVFSIKYRNRTIKTPSCTLIINNRSRIVKGTVKIQVTTINGLSMVRCQNLVNSDILDYFSVKNWPNLSKVIFVSEFQIRSTKLFYDII